MEKLIGIIIAITFASCSNKAIQSTSTEINNIQIDLLFEKDGCKMYSFYDGRPVYWSDCRGNTQTNYMSGKVHYKQTVITN